VDDYDAMLRLLTADGPYRPYADKLMLFGRFVGSWDLDIFVHQADGTRREFGGEWHFDWVLEGRGIQDVLIVRPRGERDNAPDPEGSIGSTMRVYDPRMDGWWVSWMGPDDGEFSTLFARPERDGRIVLDGQWSVGQKEGSRFEWSFSDITDRSFRWQGRISADGGASWRLAEEMDARRRAGG